MLLVSETGAPEIFVVACITASNALLCSARGASVMAKSADTERRDAAKRRAEQSRLRAAASGRPRVEWVNDALARGLAVVLRETARPADIASGIAKVDVKFVARAALRILVDERSCDRKESLGAISRALGVRDHPASKQLTSAPSALSRTPS